jgi:hypothetical protein
VADVLRKTEGAEVEIVNGGMGELRVEVDNKPAFQSSRFWYPRPGKIIKAVKQVLARSAS